MALLFCKSSVRLPLLVCLAKEEGKSAIVEVAMGWPHFSKTFVSCGSSFMKCTTSGVAIV
jgi:hypothetical protein